MEWEKLLTDERFFDRKKEGGKPYKNDYDTIICSTLFRRLQDKAQVFPLEEDDYVRTRLTHSLEVSAVGKKLGEYAFQELKKEKKDVWFDNHSEKEFSDILLCAGLVHDIGNPPFGHFGEYAVREWFQDHIQDMRLGENKITDILSSEQLSDFFNFEGNAQSLRVLSKTPYLGRMEGFNLSYAVLGTIVKYPVSSGALKADNPQKYRKFGYNVSERKLFLALDRKTGMNGSRHPLSYLLEAADDIAYRTSDMEDAMVKQVLNFSQITEAFEYHAAHHMDDERDRKIVIQCISKLKDMYQEEIDNRGRKPELTAVQRWNQLIQELMIHDAVTSFVRNYEAIMTGKFAGDLFEGTVSGHMIQAISKLSEAFIYTSSVKIKTELFGRRVIDSLLSQFMAAAVKYDTEEKLTFIDCRTMDIVSGFYKSMYRSESEGKSEGERLYLRILMITDYISGMTDNYAKRLYKELFA
ncbi:deoxyguanosinetriphosphate triphosphohydrolase [Clostridium sp. AM58-1XD]|uniref:deoxyguanosinetriphosphate triphosphohydrolase n=1 Tax=Clostridium sp. AM58-1XD TaxID=2292307 RepID=UPI000E4EE2E5|nr:deoxyguanosinetriphosphate triphosphohydrolase [Clostridium sp. AM58-1XD]RGY99856.1 deoxyguanosinetriphosphate triphosphohydrolase [Clostridium sp. AM58-1XD]